MILKYFNDLSVNFLLKIKAIYRTIQYKKLILEAKIIFILKRKKYDEDQIFHSMSLKIKENRNRGLNIKKTLQILYCGVVESQDYSGIIQDLSALGNVVVFRTEKKYGLELPSKKILDIDLIRRNSKNLLNFIDNYCANNIDIFICQLWSHIIDVETLKKIQQKGIPILLISMDDMWMKNWESIGSYKLGAIGVADGVDLILTTTREATNWYTARGYNAVYFPQGSSERVFFKSEKKNYDIVFIGNKYGIRGKFIENLIDRGIKITCFGSGWSNGSIDHTKMAEIFASSKIILGIGYVGYNKNLTTLKNRDFDATMSGALYITTYNRSLAQLFKEDEEIVFYRTLDECYTKISYYLKNDEVRERIATKGRLKAINNHTWEKRFKELFIKLNIL